MTVCSLSQVKSCNQGRGIALGADDFLPLFVWVLVQSGMMAAEIEAEYMWGLLHPSLLSGEGGYYLTTLSSAVHVLKNFRACSEEQSRAHGAGMGVDVRVGLLADFRSVLKIVVPDEVHGSIITKTLPVRPNMTTRDVCKIIAHKVRITNPQDYGLFKLVDGEVALRVSHSLLVSSDRMKPRSGDWAVTIAFHKEAALCPMAAM
ncbi:unnamed protein product [Timema podura]|uniref:Uncharacterized protein n=1 Tax=Timema podura TaxID=61482 RepID=A0ABN7NLN3_TIMPD|nr:unnamed protein product [Timema podura]